MSTQEINAAPAQSSIKVFPYAGLGHADHGWLNARHHFSFANYYDPNRVGFGTLLVINDDIIAGRRGFGMHPHKNMEIITYVRQGEISHKDSMGNAGRTGAGDVQVMSAGSGVLHSEHNMGAENTVLYQIWITPNEQRVKPRWDAREFDKTPVKDALNVLVSGMKEHEHAGALYIHQDAAIYAGRMNAGTMLSQNIKHQAYVLASDGAFTINGERMNKGDGAEVVGVGTLNIIAESIAEILVIDVPA